ncbi:hypothetical protein [Streptomyces sp. NBC_00576]|uniref:hypothetical protein n=1 Tax=Streptomyces sp. NBC_00576 TaxID=2903665 RepID=UPI002E813CA0|nr:hypothetical protein [Streptomyces sp. NBC_00576]WUB74914.1 hypothetical protein OG734_35380 [Streptomyces sp. NBC_00576]
MPHTAPAPGSPPSPPASPPRTPWWRTGRARVGFVLAVPVLGLLNAFLGFLMLLVALFLLWWGNAWRKRWKATATVAAVVLFGAVLPPAPRDNKTSDTVAEADAKTRSAGGSVSSPSPRNAADSGQEPKPTPGPEIPNYLGLRLDKAEERARADGFSTGDHDASDQDKAIWMRSNWTVCFQQADTSSDGARTIDFGAVQTGSPCPARDGGPIPWPRMPDLIGETWKAALKELSAVHVPSDRAYAVPIYGNDTLPDAGEYDEWEVCAHAPARREQITDGASVTLRLAAPENGCPAQTGDDNGSALLPDNDDDGDPDYLDPFPHDHTRNSTFPDGLTGSSGGSSGSGGSSNSSSGGGGWGGCHSRWC